MDRSVFLPVAGAGAAAFFAGHLSLYVLPGELIGLPTPMLVLGAVAGGILAALRWL
jgi:hypothetical protein